LIPGNLVKKIRAMRDIAIVSIEWDVLDLADSLPDYRVVGFIDRIGSDSGDVPILGDDLEWRRIESEHPGLKAVLAIDPPHVRRRLFSAYGSEALIGLVSPDAHIGRNVTIGHATIVQIGVIVMPRVKIGRSCKLNVNGAVHHDCVIGDFCTVSPGALLLGAVTLGDGVYVGAGSIIRQRCRIGDGATIGAGAVVVSDVQSGVTVVGVPASRRLC
jgi:sugar O-acyltransferase (sialic acid O-acetyltransferase NeuD family)